MESAGYLVSPTAELAACMENRKYNLHGRDAGLVVDPDGNTAPVVRDCDGIVFVDPDMDLSYKAPTIDELTPLWGPREMMTDLNTDVWGAEEHLEEWRNAALDATDPKPIEKWGMAIEGVSAILSQSSNEWVRMASTALNVIGQIIQATATGGINAGGGFGLFGSLISLFGGAFADGGIVGGQRYNDGIVARVSSGEMIINQADQQRLFNSIRRGESGGGGMVRMTLRGEDLISAINNYGSRSGQGKIKFER